MPARRLTVTEKRHLLWIKRLKELNCFDLMVKKLAAGEKANAVARWAMSLNVEGDPGKWTFETWRTYVQVLARQVKKQVRKADRPLEAAYRAVMEEVKQQKAEEEKEKTVRLLDEVVPEGARTVWRQVKQSTEEVDAATALKYCFIIQQARVQKMLEAETSGLFVMTGTGYKNIEVLANIAEMIRKLEIGEQWMRGKGGAMPYGGPYPGGLLPHGKVETPKSGWQKRFEALNEVDQNLVLEASSRVVDLIQEEASERLKADRLEPDVGGAAETQAQGRQSAAGPDVSIGS